MAIRYLAFLIAVCPLAAVAQTVDKPVKSVTLRYKFAPGQMQRCKMHMTQSSTLLTGQSDAPRPLDMATDMVVRQTVQSVRARDGAATSTGQIEEIHVFSNGKETPLPNSSSAQMKSPYTLVALPNGKVISFQMAGMPGSDPSKNFTGSNIVLPNHPLKIGDSWTGTAAAPLAGTQVTLTNTLTGFDRSGGYFHAIIQQKMTGVMKKTITEGVAAPTDLTGTVSGNCTYVFDVNAGAMISLACASKVAMTLTPRLSPGTATAKMPKPMKMQMQSQVTMSRIAAASAK